MNIRTWTLALLLLSTLVPLAPGASAWTCLPGADRATTVSTGMETYYERLQQSGSLTLFELWQEANGEPGLQSSAGMSCVGEADKLLRTACVGCPVRL